MKVNKLFLVAKCKGDVPFIVSIFAPEERRSSTMSGLSIQHATASAVSPSAQGRLMFSARESSVCFQLQKIFEELMLPEFNC